MANTQLPPRQKMINMMYLVLTAILALNVSNEVLDAFKNVNDGIGISNNSLQTKNSEAFLQFQRQNAIDSGKARVAFERANKARQLSQKLYALLEQYKQQMTQEAGGIDAETGKIKRDDDIDIATRLFVEHNGEKGKDLKKQIETTRNELLALLDEPDRSELAKSFSLKLDADKDGKTWEYATFNHVPVIAAVTTLSKYQNDVLAAESHIVDQLYGSIYAKSIKVDKMEAKVISPSSYILQGEAYKADVMVAASSSSLTPEVFIGSFTSAVKKKTDGGYEAIKSNSDALPLTNATKIEVDGGTGRLNLNGSGIGNKKYTGVVRVKGDDGNYSFYPFEGEYQVAPKVAVVSPTKMNVVYVGLDNPLDLSVPGVAQSDVVAVVDGPGVLKKASDGTYTLQVDQPGKKTKVKVSAKIDGRMMDMGEKEFRIKRVPDPIVKLDGIVDPGPAGKGMITARKGLVVTMGDFIYDGIQWKIVSFTATVRKGQDVIPVDNAGAVLNEKTKTLIGGMKKGDALFFDNIIAQGPGGQRKLGSIAYNITTQ
ncbi:MAG: gliding motility protein GldM [Chitinophagales bacterium]